MFLTILLSLPLTVQVVTVTPASNAIGLSPLTLLSPSHNHISPCSPFPVISNPISQFYKLVMGIYLNVRLICLWCVFSFWSLNGISDFMEVLRHVVAWFCAYIRVSLILCGDLWCSYVWICFSYSQVNFGSYLLPHHKKFWLYSCHLNFNFDQRFLSAISHHADYWKMRELCRNILEFWR